MIIKYFNLGWSELIIARQECFGVACAVTVTRRWSVGVPKVGVRICIRVGVVGDVEIVASTKRGSITIVGVDSIIVISVHGCFEWFHVVLVAE